MNKLPYSYGGAIAWVVHFGASYLLAEFGCLGGLAGIPWKIMVVTLLTLAVTAFSGYRLFRMDQEKHRFGIWSNIVFFIIIIFETIPLFFIRPVCL